MHFSTARMFARREDYEPKATPPESKLREFNLSCLKCDSFAVRFIAEYDEDSGTTVLILLCTKCRAREPVTL